MAHGDRGRDPASDPNIEERNRAAVRSGDSAIYWGVGVGAVTVVALLILLFVAPWRDTTQTSNAPPPSQTAPSTTGSAPPTDPSMPR
jgi:hypothetical protein